MRATLALITGILAVISSVMVAQAAPGQTGAFKLASPDIVQGHKIGAAQVYNSFGCSGQNISPTLGWSNPPAGTQSFALMVYDPDAPSGSGWWRLGSSTIFRQTSISCPPEQANPDQHRLPTGALQGHTDFGSHEYGGPCPPPGKPHHYHFRLYALKVAKLDVPADASAAFISFNIHANEIAEGGSWPSTHPLNSRVRADARSRWFPRDGRSGCRCLALALDSAGRARAVLHPAAQCARTLTAALQPHHRPL